MSIKYSAVVAGDRKRKKAQVEGVGKSKMGVLKTQEFVSDIEDRYKEAGKKVASSTKWGGSIGSIAGGAMAIAAGIANPVGAALYIGGGTLAGAYTGSQYGKKTSEWESPELSKWKQGSREDLETSLRNQQAISALVKASMSAYGAGKVEKGIEISKTAPDIDDKELLKLWEQAKDSPSVPKPLESATTLGQRGKQPVKYGEWRKHKFDTMISELKPDELESFEKFKEAFLKKGGKEITSGSTRQDMMALYRGEYGDKYLDAIRGVQQSAPSQSAFGPIGKRGESKMGADFNLNDYSNQINPGYKRYSWQKFHDDDTYQDIIGDFEMSIRDRMGKADYENYGVFRTKNQQPMTHMKMKDFKSDRKKRRAYKELTEDWLRGQETASYGQFGDEPFSQSFKPRVGEYWDYMKAGMGDSDIYQKSMYGAMAGKTLMDWINSNNS